MSPLEMFLATVFWTSCLALVYVYAGYPLLLLLFTRKKQPVPDLADGALPHVFFVVAAYNEELVIEKKLRNCLELDYPTDRLTFIFVSDSTDSTNEILRRYENDRMIMCILPERRGKVAALEAAFPLCTGEIVLLSDANTYYRPDAVRKLVRHFADPEVGVVTGDVRLLPSDQSFGVGEGLYYRYERALQTMESAFWATVGIDGGMYALRRHLLRPCSSSLLADDFVTGMNVARQGFRVIYDAEAIAEEDPTPSDSMEFARKVRVVAYAIQSLLSLEGVPKPSQFRLMWTFVSHKVLRWMAPLFLLTALVASFALAFHTVFWACVAGLQVLFYAMAVAAWKFPLILKSSIFRVPYYFSMVNLAALFGLFRGVRRRQGATWARTERVPVLIKPEGT